MEQELFEKLAAEVKETIATGIRLPKSNKRHFGVVDLWQIQKRRKYTGDYLTMR
jgi:hypothetical protein